MRPVYVPLRKRAGSEHRLNNEITAPRVRVVGEGIRPDVYPIGEAIKMAADLGLDLVEIVADSDPPVCKVVNYEKFLYDKKKKEKELKAKNARQVTKEIRFGPNTDEHDFNFKVKHAIKFLEEGAKVKAYVHFRGRAITYKERGEIMLLKFAQALEQHGKVDMMPKLEGMRMFLFLSPLPKKK